MSWLPPDEDAPIPRQEKKHVSKYERWERYEEGIWTDAQGRSHQLSEMEIPHIINVLEHLWTQANNDAAEEFLRMAENLEEFGDERISSKLPDTKEFWHDHPFVPLALQELEKREYDYIRPYDERRLPF